MPNSSKSNPPQLARLRACDQEMINRFVVLITEKTASRMRYTTTPKAVHCPTAVEGDQPKEVPTTRGCHRAKDFQIGLCWRRVLPKKRTRYAEREKYSPEVSQRHESVSGSPKSCIDRRRSQSLKYSRIACTSNTTQMSQIHLMSCNASATVRLFQKRAGTAA
jgi:hypothetical protein